MSDTIKLIIEIPKQAKQAFDIANDLKGGYYDYGGIIGNAIKNGIPLDDVKAEIAEKYANTHHMYPNYASGLSYAYAIIDKHISKAESEDNAK